MKNLLIIFIVGLSVACSDFLEPKSQSEYIPKEATSLNEMLLGDAYVNTTGKMGMGVLALLDDDITCSDVDEAEVNLALESNTKKFEVIEILYNWQEGAFTESETKEVGNFYANYYDWIMGANAALDYIDDVSGTEDERNNVKAQALALRAFYYFQLVNIWGAPYNYDKSADGVPLKLTSALNVKELPRNTVEEVYDQVLKDLKEAEQLYLKLPVNDQFKRDYRTSLPMVQLLLSRVYLYMEEWENAGDYATKVIENSNFSLVDLNTFEPTQGVPYYNFVSWDCPEAIWIFGSIIDDYRAYSALEMTIEQPNDWGGVIRTNFSFLNASSDLVKLYGDDDQRKTKCLVREVPSKAWGWTGGYLPCGKFQIECNANGVPTFSRGFAYAFRLSEAYLNLSEAAAHYDEALALKTLNQLREKRYAVVPTEEEGSLLDRIQVERRKELCFEGHRWFDLRRYGMPSITHDWKINENMSKTVLRYTLNERDAFYTLPISSSIREDNRNLTQNPLPGARKGVLVSAGNN